MRKFFFILLTLLLACTTAFSQKVRPTLRDYTARHAAPTTAQKIADHEEFPTLSYSFDWDSLGSWDSTYMVTIAYLPNGDQAERISNMYTGFDFTPESRQTITYSGLSTTYINAYWSGIAWENSSKYETTDDNFGNVTLDVYYNWSSSQWDTVAGNRITYQYTLTDKVAQAQIENWNQNTHLWENDYLEQYAWPNASGWDSVTYSSWNGSSWDLLDRYVDVTWHDFSSFSPITARYQSYNAPVWEDVERLRATYGPNNNQDMITEEWNGATWDSTYRDVYTYDSHGHQIGYDGYDWNGAWMLSYASLTNYTYDSQDRTSEVIYQYGYPSPIVNSFREVFPSFFTSAADPQPITIDVTAYPNPCTDRLNFQVELKQNGPVQIALYDLQGRLRMETVAPAQVGKDISLSVSEFLENGSYVYRIATKDAQASGKVVVQR